jgi:hypothetical protein
MNPNLVKVIGFALMAIATALWVRRLVRRRQLA